MNVSYQWLKSMVPIDWSPEELGERLTAVGLSVEQIEYFNKGIKNVVVGEVLSVAAHPDTQKTKWHVLEVNNGKEILTIVCGAPNVSVGIKVALAQVGAELPGGITLGAVDKSGVISYGMLCSTTELELPEGLGTAQSEGGIFILPSECTVGEEIVTALNLDDAILEIELTPNRADCLSVINIAREVAAISGKPLTVPKITLPKAVKNIKEMAKLDVEAKDLCPRYTAKLVEDVKIGPSPYWLRHRLAASGIRSISNIVDISNYVMLEMNQPSHTFDYDDLADHHIIVRRAQDKEEIVTLDENPRKLDSEMLLICDGEKPVCIAGVMGGLNTEITAKTKNILIESAYFYPKSVRQTYRKLGLPSEAASRFEKGVDMEAGERASNRICQLICELAGGTLVEGTLDSYEGSFIHRKVGVNYKRATDTLGFFVSDETIDAIMDSLGFTYEKIQGGLLVTIPHYRQDITLEVDLIEEIARLHGLDKIPATLPSGKLTEGKKTKAQKLEDKVKNTLTAVGFSEIITYSFMNKKHYDDLQLGEDDIRRKSVIIKNPFSDEQGIMRTLLLPSILTVAAGNMSRRNPNLALFEVAKVFAPIEGEKLPKETPHIVGLISGEFSTGWQGGTTKMDFFYMKGVIEILMKKLGIKNWDVDAKISEPFLHPGRSCGLTLNGEYLGYLGELHPSILETYELTEKAVVFEIDFDLLIKYCGGFVEYKAVSKYPAVDIDLAFVCDKDIAAGSIEKVITAVGGEYLSKLALFDIYEGEGILDSKKSLAYSLKFQAAKRTLKAEEINDTVKEIINKLKDELGVELRS
ncbi:MAG: phenylalanine--tRNA ligase subunit beta [Clostridiales bacterium]